MSNEPDWKAIALYLADCHAVTAAHEGTLKTTPQSRKRRYANICKVTLNLMGDPSLTTTVEYKRPQQMERVAERLRNAIKGIEQ